MTMMLARLAARAASSQSLRSAVRRRFADVAAPVRKEVSAEERAVLRAARKARASKAMQQPGWQKKGCATKEEAEEDASR